MDFAHITLSGRLTDDPSLSTIKDGKHCCKFTVASNHRKRSSKDEKTSFIPITVFGRDAVTCGEYLSKGREVFVSGRFETSKYTDQKGVKRTGFDVIAQDVTFGRGGRKNNEETEETKNSSFDDLDQPTKEKMYLEYTAANKRR